MTKIDNILAKLPLKTRAVVVDCVSSSDSECGSVNDSKNFDQLVCKSLIDYLKKVWKNSLSFHKIIHEMFEGNMNDPSFVCWLAAKLGIRQFNLERGYDLWKRNLFNETRGRKGLCLENRQLIYDEWLNNSIVTTD